MVRLIMWKNTLIYQCISLKKLPQIQWSLKTRFLRNNKTYSEVYSEVFPKTYIMHEEWDLWHATERPYKMWSVQSDKIKQHKKRVNYTINKHTIDRFKIVADKDMRKMSNIVENLIRRYVESRV